MHRFLYTGMFCFATATAFPQNEGAIKVSKKAGLIDWFVGKWSFEKLEKSDSSYTELSQLTEFNFSLFSSGAYKIISGDQIETGTWNVQVAGQDTFLVFKNRESLRSDGVKKQPADMKILFSKVSEKKIAFKVYGDEKQPWNFTRLIFIKTPI